MVFEPDDVGLSSQRLQHMRDAFQADIDKGICPASVLVAEKWWARQGSNL
jgi:hypothetical protein